MSTQMKLSDSFNLAPTQPKEWLDFGKMKVCWRQNDQDASLVRKMQYSSNINKDTTIDEAITKMKQNYKAVGELAITNDNFQYQYENVCQKLMMNAIAIESMDPSARSNYWKSFMDQLIQGIKLAWGTISYLRSAMMTTPKS